MFVLAFEFAFGLIGGAPLGCGAGMVGGAAVCLARGGRLDAIRLQHSSRRDAVWLHSRRRDGRIVRCSVALLIRIPGRSGGQLALAVDCVQLGLLRLGHLVHWLLHLVHGLLHLEHGHGAHGPLARPPPASQEPDDQTYQYAPEDEVDDHNRNDDARGKRG